MQMFAVPPCFVFHTTNQTGEGSVSPGGSASSRRGARLSEKHQVDVPSDTVTEWRDYHTRKACCKVNKATSICISCHLKQSTVQFLGGY